MTRASKSYRSTASKEPRETKVKKKTAHASSPKKSPTSLLPARLSIFRHGYCLACIFLSIITFTAPRLTNARVYVYVIFL